MAQETIETAHGHETPLEPGSRNLVRLVVGSPGNSRRRCIHLLGSLAGLAPQRRRCILLHNRTRDFRTGRATRSESPRRSLHDQAAPLLLDSRALAQNRWGFDLSGSFSGGALAFLAPGFVGEIGQTYDGMMSYGMRGGVVSALIADRIAALSTLLLYAAVALAITVGWYAAVLCIVAAALLSALTVWPSVIPWSPLCRLITWVTHRETTKDELIDSCRFRGGRAATIYGLAVIGWMFTAAKFVVAAEAVGLGVEPLRVAMALPLVSLVRLVPLTFNGLGTQEATLVLLLSGQGGSAAAAAMAIVIRVVNSVPAGILGIMALWYLARIGPSRARREEHSPPLGDTAEHDANSETGGSTTRDRA